MSATSSSATAWGREYPANFIAAARRTLEAEGVLSDHPADRGGRTKYGITKATASRHGLRVDDLTVEQAVQIYYLDYWMAAGLDRVFDPRVQAEMFDTAVNMGPGWAVRIAQRAVQFFDVYNGPVDGRLGPETAAAINLAASRWPRQLLLAMNGFQFVRYVAIADADPAQREAFFRGWMLRLEVPEEELRQ